MEEKKESWIEKLIELLNEFEPYIASDWEHRDNLWGYAYQWHSAVFPKELAESYIISARYWFIKWLVDNDKIDFDTIPNKIKEIWMPILIQWEIQYWFDSSDLYWLLMVLSIQDNPIEFLVSILK